MAACSDDKGSNAGSDSTAGSSTEAISKAEFVAQGNALCTALDEHLDPIGEAVASEDDAIAFLADELVPRLRDTVSQIRALGFPAGDEELLASLMDDTDAVLTEIEADPATFAQTTDDPFAEINAQLITYGLTVCGQAE